MKIIKITKADLDEDNKYKEGFIGKYDEREDVSVEIDGGLGLVVFSGGIYVTGSITASAGSGISAGYDISAGSGISAGRGISAVYGISAGSGINAG